MGLTLLQWSCVLYGPVQNTFAEKKKENNEHFFQAFYMFCFTSAWCMGFILEP